MINKFRQRALHQLGRSSAIEKINSSIFNPLPKLGKSYKKPFNDDSSDEENEICYFEPVSIRDGKFKRRVPSYVSREQNKCITINALITEGSDRGGLYGEKNFWIRTASTNKQELTEIAFNGQVNNNGLHDAYGFSAIAIEQDSKGYEVVFFGSSEKMQTGATEIIQSPDKTRMFTSDNKPIEIKKWTKRVNCSPKENLWLTIVINPDLRIMGDNPCISIHLQEAHIINNTWVKLGKFLHSEPIALYADAYTCNQWQRLGLRAGSMDMAHTEIGLRSFVNYPLDLATNSNLSGEAEKRFPSNDRIALIKRTAEVIPHLQTRAVPCFNDIIGSPLHPIDNFLLGFHVVGVLLGLSSSYCKTLLRGVTNEPLATTVAIIPQIRGKSTKPKFKRPALNLKTPTLANLVLSGATDDICKVPRNRPKILQPRVLTYWEQARGFNQTSLLHVLNLDNDPRAEGGICLGLTLHLTAGLVTGQYTGQNIDDNVLEHVAANAVATQGEVDNITNVAADIPEAEVELTDYFNRAFPNIDATGFVWTQQNGLEGLLQAMLNLQVGEALLFAFDFINPDAAANDPDPYLTHTIVFFRQETNRLIFLDVDGGVWRGIGGTIEQQARELITRGSFIYQAFQIPENKTFSQVAFIIRNVEDDSD